MATFFFVGTKVVGDEPIVLRRIFLLQTLLYCMAQFWINVTEGLTFSGVGNVSLVAF